MSASESRTWCYLSYLSGALFIILLPLGYLTFDSSWYLEGGVLEKIQVAQICAATLAFLVAAVYAFQCGEREVHSLVICVLGLLVVTYVTIRTGLFCLGFGIILLRMPLLWKHKSDFFRERKFQFLMGGAALYISAQVVSHLMWLGGASRIVKRSSEESMELFACCFLIFAGCAALAPLYAKIREFLPSYAERS